MNKAVFTTSDIQRFKGMAFGPSTASNELESTGKLEKAIEQGYEVFVITSRTVFKPEVDDWWLNQVSKVYTGYTGDGASDEGMIETYKRFYRDQNINPDDMVVGFIGPDSEEMSKFQENYLRKIYWMDYQDKLECYGFKTGKDF